MFVPNWNYGLVIRELNFQPRGPVFKITGWLQAPSGVLTTKIFLIWMQFQINPLDLAFLFVKV